VKDLPTTLSTFTNLGMALEDVVATSTATPAKAIGRSGELGTSRIGVG
jgi:predicted amidohydrolase